MNRAMPHFVRAGGASFLFVAGLSLLAGRFYGQLLLPLYRWEMALLFPHQLVLDLRLVEHGNEIFFRMQSMLSAPHAVGLRVLDAGTTLTGSTLLGHALQHPLVLLSITLTAWMIRRGNGVRFLLYSFAALLLIEMADVPLVLMSSTENILWQQFAPDATSDSMVIYWMNFMNGGGRLALSITGGIVTILLAQKATSGQRTG